jgi:hypothetical protein
MVLLAFVWPRPDWRLWALDYEGRLEGIHCNFRMVLQEFADTSH